MTSKKFAWAGLLGLLVGLCPIATAQNAGSLKAVRSVYVGSFGDDPGAQELRNQLIRVLRHNHNLQLTSLAQADALLEGMGEIWVRGYHSLSPRARTNDVYAEPIYGGYLSVIVKGSRGDILWSYFVNPKRVGFGGDVKHYLAEQLVDKFTEAINESTASPAVPGSLSGNSVTLHGAGATFPFPIYERWFTSFRNASPSVLLAYEPIGSQGGVTELLAGNLDFAGSDIPLRALPEAAGNAHFLEFPSVAGAVVLIYNLPGFGGDLRLSSQVLAGMLDGRIRQWNDPAIRTLNPGSSLPDKQIQLVHRSDGSGTTFALTEYLSKVSEDWKKTVGEGPTVHWPMGAGAQGNEGVSKLVEQTPYSFGYTEFVYAFRRRLSFASIQNAAGKFIQADLPGIAAAAGSVATLPPDFAISLSNAPGRDSYPISAFTWLIIPAGTKDPAKNRALRRFLEWMLVAGQRQCMALGYAPLPNSLVEREQKALQSMK